MNILTIGDVCGEGGIKMVERHLRTLKQQHAIDICVVNGENAAVMGILPQQATRLFTAGADVVTLGNHTWHKRDIAPAMDNFPQLVRPYNYPAPLPGVGYCIVHSASGQRVCVVSLIGRCMMNDVSSENPFWAMERLFKAVQADIFVVDFHGEATSEKLAMAYHLDGRASVLFGTHTHVPTADEQIFPNGLGYITDVGMTGPIDSVLGIRPELSLNHFLGGVPIRFEPPDTQSACKLQGAVFSVDDKSHHCIDVLRLDIR